MPDSPHRAAAHKLACSHFPLVLDDDMTVKLTLGELATFAEEAMTQAARRLDVPHTASTQATWERLTGRANPKARKGKAMLHGHPLFPPLDNRCRAYHVLEGLRQALIAQCDHFPERRRLILNVPNDESSDNLKTHLEEFKALLTDGIGAISDLIAEVELKSATGPKEGPADG